MTKIYANLKILMTLTLLLVLIMPVNATKIMPPDYGTEDYARTSIIRAEQKIEESQRAKNEVDEAGIENLVELSMIDNAKKVYDRYNILLREAKDALEDAKKLYNEENYYEASNSAGFAYGHADMGNFLLILDASISLRDDIGFDIMMGDSDCDEKELDYILSGVLRVGSSLQEGEKLYYEIQEKGLKNLVPEETLEQAEQDLADAYSALYVGNTELQKINDYIREDCEKAIRVSEGSWGEIATSFLVPILSGNYELRIIYDGFDTRINNQVRDKYERDINPVIDEREVEEEITYEYYSDDDVVYSDLEDNTYEILERKGKMRGRFLNVFPIEATVDVKLNAETGEVKEIKKPWYSFLVAWD